MASQGLGGASGIQNFLNNINQGKTLLNTKIPGTNIQATAGWYVFIGCTGSILLAATPVAPVVLAVMSLALLYQLTQLLQGT